MTIKFWKPDVLNIQQNFTVIMITLIVSNLMVTFWRKKIVMEDLCI